MTELRHRETDRDADDSKRKSVRETRLELAMLVRQ
jgi:hypothetical protein